MHLVLCHSVGLGMQAADTSSWFSVCVINCLTPFLKKGRKRMKSFSKKYGLNNLRRRMEKVDDGNDSRSKIVKMASMAQCLVLYQ